MNGKSSLLLTVALVSSSFGGPTLAHAEEVNMSRLRATAVMPPQATANPLSVYQAVDPTAVDAFCGDEDGCAVRFQMLSASPPQLRGGQRTLYKSDTTWASNVDTSSHVDGDGLSTDVIPMNLEPGDICRFSDVNDTGTDSATGFSVVADYLGTAGSTPGYTCVLTLID